MTTWVYIFCSVLIVSLISLIGVFTLSMGAQTLRKIILYMVSFAVGGLFGDALIHLIPESFREIPSSPIASFCILGGILIFFILEKFLRWQHCHVPASKEHVHPVVTLNIVGDSFHNMIDGMLIAASFLASIPIGITTTIAVILHEIPQEMGHFGILVHGGVPVKRALVLNFLSALSSFFGAFIVLLIGTHAAAYSVYLLPITAGGFLYIAGSDLIPELHHGELHHGHEVSIRAAVGQFLCIVLGIALMAALLLLDKG